MPANVQIYLTHIRDILKLQFITPNLRPLFANQDTVLPANLVSSNFTDSFVVNLGFYPVFLLAFYIVGVILYFMIGKWATSIKAKIVPKLKWSWSLQFASIIYLELAV